MNLWRLDLSVVLLALLILGSTCAPPFQGNDGANTAEPHFTPMRQTYPGAVTDIVMGVTTKPEIRSLWGPPTGETESSWWYEGDVEDDRGGTALLFEGSVVTSIYSSGGDLSLLHLIEEVGQPPIVEIVLGKPGDEPPIYPKKILHYPEAGISYVLPCIIEGIYRRETCAENFETERIEEIRQYQPYALSEFQPDPHHGQVVNWTDFSGREFDPQSN